MFPLTRANVSACCLCLVHDSKAAGLLQSHKFANRSAIQLTIAPVLASLPSFSTQLQRTSSTARAATPTNGQQTTTNNPNALRNITNGRNAIAPTGTSDSRGRGSSTPSVPHKSGAGPSQSTLAQLTALNGANVPLASHQRKKYGMAATQAREQQQQAQNTQRAFESTTNNNQPQQAQSARKRKNTGQNA